VGASYHNFWHSTPLTEMAATLPDDTRQDIKPCKCGSIIFRTDYTDETRSKSLLNYIIAQVRARMQEEDIAHRVPNIDWKVRT